MSYLLESCLKMTEIWQMCRQSFVNGKLSEEQIGQLEELPTMMEEILWHLGFQCRKFDLGILSHCNLRYEARWGPEERWQRHAEALLDVRGHPLMKEFHSWSIATS